MDMSHKNKYMGKVVGDGEEFVLCTLYTWMKIASCNHVQYSSSTWFWHKLGMNQSSTWPSLAVIFVSYLESKRNVSKNYGNSKLHLSLQFRHCSFLMRQIRLSRGPFPPGWLWRLCAWCWETHIRKQVCFTDWLSSRCAWPWSGFLSKPQPANRTRELG